MIRPTSQPVGDNADVDEPRVGVRARLAWGRVGRDLRGVGSERTILVVGPGPRLATAPPSVISR